MPYHYYYFKMIITKFLTTISVRSKSWCVWTNRPVTSSNMYAQISLILRYSLRGPLWEKSNSPLFMRKLGKSPLVKLSPTSPLRNLLNIRQWCSSTSSAPVPGKISASQSWMTSFALQFMTSRDQRIFCIGNH